MTDTLQNNLITVAPDGTISETLTGKLDAAGVVFPEFTSIPSPDTSQIQWTRADGTLVASILGGENLPATGAQTQLFLLAESPDLVGAPISGIEIAANLLGAAQFVQAFANGIQVRIMSGDGTSDFLRLLSRQQLQLAGPFDTGVSPTIVQNSEWISANIAHGLGRTPKAVLGNLYDGNWSSLCSWRAAQDATNVVIHIGNAGAVAATTAGLKFYVVG